jgi:glutaminase
MADQPKPPGLTSPILDFLHELHEKFASLSEGKVATYIPELAKANPSWFGICLVTSGGSVYEVGDSRQEFTIQSISKPFVYGLALEDQGRSSVLERVGVEPTGDAFNSISLDPGTGRPRNPMINAGAIATAGLIEGKDSRVKLRRIREMMSLYAGRKLGLDELVYRSESETGHRNRAIGHMLRNFDKLTNDPIPVVDLYFKQCSISVTCRDLGMMAATLANRGINPITGKQAIRSGYVENVLSVMGSCGMYDYAGEWIYQVGMPAKSGVAGGVIAVLPGQLGIGVFSPPLDARGNSERGIAVCSEISRHLDLHLFNRPSSAHSIIRNRATDADLMSSRVRTARESQALREHGAQIRIYQLQGNITFPTSEALLKDVMSNLENASALVLDFKRALTINESACRFLFRLLEKLRARGAHMVFAHAQNLPLLKRFMKAKLGTAYESVYRAFDDLDLALEWCEDQLLAKALPGWGENGGVTPREYDLFKGLSPSQVATLTPLLQRKSYRPGEVLIQVGDKATDLFFLARGAVSVLMMPNRGGTVRRLATFSAGMSFGELAMLDRAPRSAMVVADSEVECDLLSVEDFEALSRNHPELKIAVLQNLCLELSGKLRKANRQLAALE